jgi:hypothetical protein
MATISSNGKVAYIYDTQTDTWYPVAGTTNTSANYQWTGTHSFASNPVTFDQVVRAKAGVNNFLNPTARDAVITSPSDGIVCFVRQTDVGVQINQVQYYYNGLWRSVTDSADLAAKVASYTLVLSDAGKTITMSSIDPAATVVTIPPASSAAFALGQRLDIIRIGTGEVSVAAGVGVTINSKNSNKRISSQFSGATIIKTDTNTWVLIGDLKA